MGFSRNPIAVALDLRRARLGGPAGIAARQQVRFCELVEYARMASPYYRHLYQGLQPHVSDPHLLPPTSKRELMANFDDWVTDPGISLAGVREFISDPARIGVSYLGKYNPMTTSGSTGEPAIIIHDQFSWMVLFLTARVRMTARITAADVAAIARKGFRTAAFFATGGHYGGEVLAAKVTHDHPWIAPYVRVFSVMEPTNKLIEELNAYQPATIGGYPSALLLMATAQIAGKLDIHPVLARTAGENLSQEMRSEIAGAFGCRVIDSYASTEAPALGTECEFGWQHINTDWYVFEPVNADKSPTPPGELSSTVLVTNLSNRVQPFIRYDLGDRIMEKPDPCSCGSPFPAVKVMGRSGNLMSFAGSVGEEIPILPLALGSVIEKTPGMHRFQAIKSGPTSLRLRIATEPDALRSEVFAAAASRIFGYLTKQGAVAIEVSLDDEEPHSDPRTGKFREVYTDPLNT